MSRKNLQTRNAIIQMNRDALARHALKRSLNSDRATVLRACFAGGK